LIPHRRIYQPLAEVIFQRFSLIGVSNIPKDRLTTVFLDLGIPGAETAGKQIALEWWKQRVLK